MTPLRQRMIEDMRIRNFTEQTQTSYCQYVSQFARHFRRSPEHLGPEDIPAYQYHLVHEKKLSASSLFVAVGALRSLYKVTLKKDWPIATIIPTPKRQTKLPVVLNQDEVCRLLEAVVIYKHRVILTTSYAAGLRISEAICLTPLAIDSEPMTIRVDQGKGRLRDALSEAAADSPRVVPGGTAEALAPSRRHPRHARHARCGRKSLQARPAAVRDHQARHPAFPASLLRGTPPRGGHRRPHDSAPARAPAPHHHGAVSPRRSQHGLRDDESAGLAPATGAGTVCTHRVPVRPRPGLTVAWAPRSKWRTSSVATGIAIGSGTRCRSQKRAPAARARIRERGK